MDEKAREIYKRFRDFIVDEIYPDFNEWLGFTLIQKEESRLVSTCKALPFHLKYLDEPGYRELKPGQILFWEYVAAVGLTEDIPPTGQEILIVLPTEDVEKFFKEKFENIQEDLNSLGEYFDEYDYYHFEKKDVCIFRLYLKK